MQSMKTALNQELKNKPFDLKHFLKEVFLPKEGERIAILIDLVDRDDVKDFSFLKSQGVEGQKIAYEIFYKGLKNSVMKELSLSEVGFFAYTMTEGNNMELPEDGMDISGKIVNMEKEIYAKYDIILSITTHSATAPLSAHAREYEFRGASLPGINEFVLQTGLSTDTEKLVKVTENIRKGLTDADSADIYFEVNDLTFKLHVYLGDQVAQKNDGTCYKKKELINLPGGKVYFVPYDAEGSFPMKFEDGTIAHMQVSKGRIKKVKLIQGNIAKVNAFQKKIDNDKVLGVIGELGFGTSTLPYSGCYIQDGKIFGTLHLGIGRNDHLHGSITLNRFADKKNAVHEDILFSKEKNPEIKIAKVTIKKGPETETLIENDIPAPYLIQLFDRD